MSYYVRNTKTLLDVKKQLELDEPAQSGDFSKTHKRSEITSPPAERNAQKQHY